MPNTKRKKIIWAIDPFGAAKVQTSAASLAKSLSLSNDVEVVFVYGRSRFLLDDRKPGSHMDLSHVETKLGEILKELKYKPKTKPRILAHESDFVRADVKTLVSYADKVKADAVLVSTNARTGFVKQALGSFSETLILSSAIPTMIVNPKAEVGSKPGVILFPTDFTDSSWKAFQQVVSFAKTSKAKIKIFHQLQSETRSMASTASFLQNEQWVDAPFPLDERLPVIKLHLSKWLSWAKKHGVKCSHVIQFGSKNIADATLAVAKKEQPWMIAMATVTGPLAATFLGSNARWIVRAAKCPVWVLYVK